MFEVVLYFADVFFSCFLFFSPSSPVFRSLLLWFSFLLVLGGLRMVFVFVISVGFWIALFVMVFVSAAFWLVSVGFRFAVSVLRSHWL